jgi:hypothetical protein
MALEKLTIVPEGGAPIKALFNPERYRLNKGVKLAEIQIPGLDWPVVQFVRGENEKVSFELFFDTTSQGTVDNVEDVRAYTGQVHALLRVDGQTHAPPRCILHWGEAEKIFSFGTRVSPWCVLESVSEEFVLFSPAGIPLRAKQNVTFRAAWTIEEQLWETPRHTSNRTSVGRVEPGETLSHLATREYGDPAAWRLIAEFNAVDDPLAIEPGTRLRLPRTDVRTGR